MSNSKIVGVLLGGIGLGGAIGTGVGLKLNKNLAGNSSTCSVDGGGSTNTTLFELDKKTYTAEDVPAEAQDTMYQIQSQSFETASNYSKELALRIALASEGGKAVDMANLPNIKTLLKLEAIPEAELKAFYEKNKKTIPAGTTYEQIKPQLENFMSAQKSAEVSRAKISDFEKSGRFQLKLTRPTAPMVNLNLAGYPVKGASDSKVTLVEVTDYLCSHCRNAQPEVESLLKEFGNKVKFVQVNFALRPEGFSGVLAMGGVCAQKQGQDQFWKFHSKAFTADMETASKDAKSWQDAAIKAATDSALDIKEFEKCLADPATRQTVDATNEMMSKAGVAGTPTYFLNNRKVAAGGGDMLATAIKSALAK